MKKIRVIKRKDVESKNEAIQTEKPHAPETARKMVTNVSAWVNEFQKRKRSETKHAIETLLTKRPQNASS